VRVARYVAAHDSGQRASRTRSLRRRGLALLRARAADELRLRSRPHERRRRADAGAGCVRRRRALPRRRLAGAGRRARKGRDARRGDPAHECAGRRDRDRRRHRVVRLADGTSIEADAVLIAAGPTPPPSCSTAPRRRRARLGGCRDARARRLPRRRAARLPRPRATFALGIDRPLYLPCTRPPPTWRPRAAR
jgi:hypothetical protein